MSEQTLTHKDLATLLGVSETTVKSYRRKFPGCIPVASKGKPIRFTQDAANVALRIRDLFETGMSVDEVRARLAAEFDWISPENPVPVKEGGKGEGRGADVGPELSHGVSNMAKSLVAMTQQQKAILARIQGLESLLEELGAGDAAADSPDASAGGASTLAEAAGKRAEAMRQREELLDERLATLDRLDGMVSTLTANMQELSGRLDGLLARRAKAAEDWRQSGRDTLTAAAQTAGEAMRSGGPAPGQPQEQPQEQAQESAKVIPMRPNGAQHRSASPEPGRDAMDAAEGQARQPANELVREPAKEPERRFFSLPLVARTEQGQFISAGGKSRGPFSLNDLKAMLIYGFTPPNHFTLRFESHGQGWWLTLEQETSGRRIRLLLMELPTQRGGSVAEILQIVNDNDNVHPAEVCAIIDSFVTVPA